MNGPLVAVFVILAILAAADGHAVTVVLCALAALTICQLTLSLLGAL